MLPALCTLIALIVFIAIARISGSARDKQGNTLNQVITHSAQNASELKEQSATRFTVGTFNIQGGKDLAGNRDITRAADAIKDIDVIGIQEVYAPGFANKLGLGSSQTNTLATAGGFNWLFCATRTRWFREFRGNAFLSKLPTKSWQTNMLPNIVGKNFRNMTVVEMSWQGQPFHFINTHLHTKGGKQEQFNVVLNEFNKYPRAILVGDFNSFPSESHIIKALEDNSIVDAINLAKIDHDEKNRIDWILTKGFKVHGGCMTNKGISDHPLYQVTLSII